MRVLVSAYACDPRKGSEPGAGWNWAVAAAEGNEVWLLTRGRNATAIEAEIASRPRPSLRVVYVEVPPPLLRLKSGERGLRYYAYYVLWQLAALRAARRLHGRHRFDVVHHVTFANVWLPALVGFIDAPFVLGPVGGGPRVPLRFYPELGASGAAREACRCGLQTLSRLSPLTRATWRRARSILVQNEETRRALPARHRIRAVTRPNASAPAPLTARSPRARTTDGPWTALLAGRLVAWKGGSLALRVIARAPDWKLTVVGSGPDHGRLQALASELRLLDRVRFVPWLDRDDLWEEMRRSDALLLPSFREDASFVTAEAQTLGLPVVAFRQGGPRELSGYPGSTVVAVPLGTPDPAGALLTGLRHVQQLERASDPEPYELAQITRFLASTYETVAAPGAVECGTRESTSKGAHHR